MKLHLKMRKAWRSHCGVPLHEEINVPRRVFDKAVFLKAPEDQRCKGCDKSVKMDGRRS